MAYDDALFPSIASSLRTGASWSTTVDPAGGGSEVRTPTWLDSRRRYVARTKNMTLATFLAVEKHHNGRRGRARAFPLLDNARYLATTEPFGTGDGSITTFQLTINQGDTANAYNREIRKPKSTTIQIFDNAVLKTETTHYTIDYQTGIVTFVAAPAVSHVLTWSGTYYTVVRYEVDELSPQLIVWSASGQQIVAGPDIQMVECRDFGSISSPPAGLPDTPVLSASATGLDVHLTT
jgi:uncharacterized protein (TIGR02217 family)